MLGFLIALLICLGACLYLFFSPHVRVFSASNSQEFAQKYGGTSSLPASAKNIRIELSSVSIGGRAHIVKFEATEADCKEYVRAEFKVYAHWDGKAESGLQYIEIASSPSLPPKWGQRYGIRNPDWFDVSNIRHGLELKRGNRHNLRAWIDTDRNILYLYCND